MLDVTIDPTLADPVPDLVLGWVAASVANTDHDPGLWARIDALAEGLSADLPVADIAALPAVVAQRAAYKALGKDPSRYRGSAEALLRRVAQGKGLYRVNTLVDLNNLLSLETGNPLGCYDRDRLEPPLLLRAGQAGESYPGIGKGALNIENLPVLADRQGPFGSPTSDSQRSAVGADTRQVLLVVFAFGGAEGLDATLERAAMLLERHAQGRQISIGSVGGSQGRVD